MKVREAIKILQRMDPDDVVMISSETELGPVLCNFVARFTGKHGNYIILSDERVSHRDYKQQPIVKPADLRVPNEKDDRVQSNTCTVNNCEQLLMLDMLIRYAIWTKPLCKNIKLGDTDWDSLRQRTLKIIEKSFNVQGLNHEDLCELLNDIQENTNGGIK